MNNKFFREFYFIYVIYFLYGYANEFTKKKIALEQYFLFYLYYLFIYCRNASLKYRLKNILILKLFCNDSQHKYC